MSGDGRIPFPFVPVPWTAFTAQRDGVLTVTEFRLLLALYARWTPGRNLTVRVRDLDSLAVSMAWEGKNGTLSKALRSLRTKRWIRYESRPGRIRHAYDIELRPDRSEHDPSSDTSNQAASRDSAVTADPSRGLLDPSSGQAANTLRNRDSAAAESESVRAAKDLSRRTTSLEHEDAGPARAHEETPEEAALFDTFWAKTGERGAYWEPDS